MRISVGHNNAGYAPLSKTADVKIFLDGVEVSVRVTADEDNGYIVCHVVDSDNYLAPNSSGTDTMKVTKYGKVRIEL